MDKRSQSGSRRSNEMRVTTKIFLSNTLRTARSSLKGLLGLAVFVALCCFLSVAVNVRKAVEETKQSLLLDKGIYFLQLSRYPFSALQLCAIESAARQNPKRNVSLIIALPETEEASASEITALHGLRMAYDNILLETVNITESFLRSKLREWYERQLVQSSKYYVYHLSDAFRYLIMYHKGGAYLDMDVISLRSLPSEPFLALEGSPGVFMNSVMQSNSHDYLFKMILELIPKAYDPNDRTSIGGSLVATAHSQSKRFRVYPPNAFSPFNYVELFHVFNQQKDDWEKFHERVSASIAVHFSDFTSKASSTDQSIILEELYIKYCPESFILGYDYLPGQNQPKVA